MTLTAAPRETTFQRPAWLLVLTLPAFVAYLVLAVATVATKVETSSAELTPAQLSDLGPSWVALHLLWMLPSVLAAVGLAQLASRWQLQHAGAGPNARRPRGRPRRGVPVVQLLAFGFDGRDVG